MRTTEWNFVVGKFGFDFLLDSRTIKFTNTVRWIIYVFLGSMKNIIKLEKKKLKRSEQASKFETGIFEVTLNMLAL